MTRSVCRELREIRPDIFAQGGDRDLKDALDPNSSQNPEARLCSGLGIEIVYGVGRAAKCNQAPGSPRKTATRAIASAVQALSILAVTANNMDDLIAEAKIVLDQLKDDNHKVACIMRSVDGQLFKGVSVQGQKNTSVF